MVADADEALGKDVEQEAAEELVDGEREDLGPGAVGVVAVAEGDLIGLDAENPAVRERDAMRVAPEVPEHALGSRKGDLNLLVSDALPGPGARYEYGNLSLAFQDDFGTIVGQVLIVFAPEPGRISAALAAFAGLALAARQGRLVVPLAEAES